MSDKQEPGVYQANDGPAECCVFCDREVPADAAEVEIVTMSDYMDTPLGEQTPARRVGLCFHHEELLMDRAEKTTKTVVL